MVGVLIGVAAGWLVGSLAGFFSGWWLGFRSSERRGLSDEQLQDLLDLRTWPLGNDRETH